MLLRVFGDGPMDQIFAEEAIVATWLRTEAALAEAQAATGQIDGESARLIAEACRKPVDLERLWAETRIVGYPILPLVRLLAERLPEGPNGRLHLGATTQDIMDTGLALTLSAACDRLDELLVTLGTSLAAVVSTHRATVMPARTHGQQAVPTTFGAKMAVFLTQVGEVLSDCRQARQRVAVLSLHGAGGTSASMGETVGEVRACMGDLLGLRVDPVPGHVDRLRLHQFGTMGIAAAAVCARLAREVIDLSRTEIAEVAEPDTHLGGASSTMPQKANPIRSEAVVGMAATTEALAGALARTLEAGHERASGEWQIEWHVIPQVARLSAGCVSATNEVINQLTVNQDRMQTNLDADNGLLVAEAYMMTLAPHLGRERAHDIVYQAARHVRNSQLTLPQAITELIGDETQPPNTIQPADYLGETERICHAALDRWELRKENHQ